MKSNNNFLLTTEDELLGNESFTDSERNSDSNYEYIDVFYYENLCQEYNFRTGETSLYIKHSDNKYELLYESSIENGLESASFYSKNSAFILEGYNPDSQDIASLAYFTKKDFIKFMNTKIKSEKFPILDKALDLLTPFFISKSYTSLVRDGVHNTSTSNNELLKEYRELFIKYKCTSAYIPVINILEKLIDYIHTYIASGELDMKSVKLRYSELQNFQKLCPNSYSLISSFINNPESTDLRLLCDSLKKSSTNVENLINLYFKDELNIQTRGENDDCK